MTQLLARARLFIGVFQLEVRPANEPASVEIDGRPSQLAPDKRVLLGVATAVTGLILMLTRERRPRSQARWQIERSAALRVRF